MRLHLRIPRTYQRLCRLRMPAQGNQARRQHIRKKLVPLRVIRAPVSHTYRISSLSSFIASPVGLLRLLYAHLAFSLDFTSNACKPIRSDTRLYRVPYATNSVDSCFIRTSSSATQPTLCRFFALISAQFRMLSAVRNYHALHRFLS